MHESPKVKRLFPRTMEAAEVRVSDITESMESGAKLLKLTPAASSSRVQ